MANGSSITVRGDRQISVKLQNFSRDFEEKVKKSVKKHTYMVERDAKINAPYDTGHLKRSIHSGFQDGGLTGTVTVGAYYGIYLEFGTRYMHPRPFLFPAFLIAKASFLREMESIARGVGE